MNTIIPTWIFYAISVLSDIGFTLGVLSWAGLIIFSIYLYIGIKEEYFKEDKNAIKQCKKFAVCLAILLSVTCFFPSKETMYTMLANSFITTDNLETFKGNAKELTDYIFEKITELKGGADI